MSATELLFSFRGRINRAKWWLVTLVSLLVMIVAVFAVAILIATGNTGAIILAVLLIFTLVGASLWIGLAVGAKRLHDRDKSAWWLVPLYVVPNILQAIGDKLEGPVAWVFYLAALGLWIWAIVELGILRGTEGPNQYGPDPLQATAATQPA